MAMKFHPDNKKKRLTKTGFISWLKSNDFDTVVGHSGKGSENPIATYLRLLDYPNAEVGVGIGVTCKSGFKTFRMKTTLPWIEAFTTSITGLNGRHALTAERCLEIVSDLKPNRKW